jgi:hypothetical protein
MSSRSRPHGPPLYCLGVDLPRGAAMISAFEGYLRHGRRFGVDDQLWEAAADSIEVELR